VTGDGQARICEGLGVKFPGLLGAISEGRPYRDNFDPPPPNFRVAVTRSEWEIHGNILTQDTARAAQLTTSALSCCTNAGRGARAVCSSDLRCQHRSPSVMEYVRDEGGSAASARSGDGARSRL
jgi:hypothetical protein